MQQKLATRSDWSAIQLVIFSVDPTYDTPDVLQRYAAKYGADPEHWHFLTGSRREIWELSKNGFKLPVSEAPADADSPLLHSRYLVLVDSKARVRGFYDGLSEEGLSEISRDLETVASEDKGGVLWSAPKAEGDGNSQRGSGGSVDYHGSAVAGSTPTIAAEHRLGV